MQKTVLVVDDDDELRGFLKKVLSVNNFKVIEASDGAQALEYVEKYLPDLVLLDFGLPKVSGQTVCVKIKKDHPEIIVIALTEKNGSFDVVHGLQIGADDYMSKPFVEEELIARIDTRIKAVAKEQGEVSDAGVGQEQVEEMDTRKIVVRESIVLVAMKLIFTEIIFAVFLLILNFLFSYLDLNANVPNLADLYLIVMSGGFLINIGLIIMISLKWNSEYATVSKDGVVKHSGILHRKEQKYACNFVEGTKLEQSFLGLLLNYGTIELYDPALKEQVYLLNIANPKKYSKAIQDFLSKENSKTRPFVV